MFIVFIISSMSCFHLAFICAVIVAASCSQVCVKGFVKILDPSSYPLIELIQGMNGRRRDKLMADTSPDSDGTFELCGQSDNWTDVFDPVLQIVSIKGDVVQCYKYPLPASVIDSQNAYDMGDIYTHLETAKRCQILEGSLLDNNHN